MAQITVKVTKADIRKGKPRDSHFCPVALALKRATGRPWVASITWLYPGSVEEALPNRGDRMRLTPPEVTHFMREFDEGNKCAPFSFTLEA